MDDRRDARPDPRFRWRRLFSFLAQLWRPTPGRLQPVPAARGPQPRQPEGSDWGDLWSTVHW